MEKEFIVILNRQDDLTAGLGFSLLDKPGFPPIIYDIEENSPAAENGKVEAGDVLLKINDVEVVNYSIKEVLKCLRLAGNSVVLKLKRDPALKEKILLYLSSIADNPENNFKPEEKLLNARNNIIVCKRHNNSLIKKKDSESQQIFSPLQNILTNRNAETETTNSQPMFEAYVMTGERVLKLTKNPSHIPKYQKKIDSLRFQNEREVKFKQNYKFKSTPSSPVESQNYVELKSSSADTSPVSPSAVLQTNSGTIQSQNNQSFVLNVFKSNERIPSEKSTSVSSTSVQVESEELISLNTYCNSRSDSKAEDKKLSWMCNASRSVAEESPSTIVSSENISLEQSASSPSFTSISSSVMSSVSSLNDKKRLHRNNSSNNGSLDSSQIEILSNISSPDYQEETSDILNSHDIGMEVTDPSDSDSTLLASEPKIRRLSKHNERNVDRHDMNGGYPYKSASDDKSKNHRIVIQVRAAEKDNKLYNLGNTNCVTNNINSNISKLKQYNNLQEEGDEGEINIDTKKNGYEALSECDDELLALTEGAVNLANSISPPHSGSEEESGSDVESLHSFHYSPKGVDYPSARRLAKRLYYLDGFKKSDVSRHLSKNNEFNRAVAEEYLKHFDFSNETLDEALRIFLKQFSLTGETQERERVIVHFSKRYLDCNKGSFNSQDAVHTLTCAIMLLNTDLHGPNIGRKMNCTEFIDNLSGLNDGENFPRDILKSIYQTIKNCPLEWAIDEEITEDMVESNILRYNNAETCNEQDEYSIPNESAIIKKNIEMNLENKSSVMDYKKGYVFRKCCFECNGKRTNLGKRSWKLFFCILRDLILYLQKDDQELNTNSFSNNSSNTIKLHHALATKATDYTKKQHVFRLQTADRAEYLFQTSDNKELQSWVDTINLVCASFSAPALPEPVGSQKKFQRPFLPSAPSKLNLMEQLQEHEKVVEKLEKELENHRKHVPDKSSKNLVIHNYKEKELYLSQEIKRYKTYIYLLQSKLPQIMNTVPPEPLEDIDSQEKNTINTVIKEELLESNQLASENRYSYRAAIYSNTDSSGDFG